MRHDFQSLNQIIHFPIIKCLCFEIEVDMPIRIKRRFFYFKLNVIVEIRLLANFDYCTLKQEKTIHFAMKTVDCLLK